jgi:hypothetical protein
MFEARPPFHSGCAKAFGIACRSFSDRQAGDVYMIALPSGRSVGKLAGFDSATGTRVGVVKFDDASIVSGPFWIASNGNAQTLYALTVEDSIESVGVYRYPSGGERAP